MYITDGVLISPASMSGGEPSIVELVQSRFRGSWPAALKAFVLDPSNAWCPVWIARNYEVQNQVLRGVHGIGVVSGVVLSCGCACSACAGLCV